MAGKKTKIKIKWKIFVSGSANQILLIIWPALCNKQTLMLVLWCVNEKWANHIWQLIWALLLCFMWVLLLSLVQLCWISAGWPLAQIAPHAHCSCWCSCRRARETDPCGGRRGRGPEPPEGGGDVQHRGRQVEEEELPEGSADGCVNHCERYRLLKDCCLLLKGWVSMRLIHRAYVGQIPWGNVCVKLKFRGDVREKRDEKQIPRDLGIKKNVPFNYLLY